MSCGHLPSFNYFASFFASEFCFLTIASILMNSSNIYASVAVSLNRLQIEKFICYQKQVTTHWT